LSCREAVEERDKRTGDLPLVPFPSSPERIYPQKNPLLEADKYVERGTAGSIFQAMFGGWVCC